MSLYKLASTLTGILGMVVVVGAEGTNAGALADKVDPGWAEESSMASMIWSSSPCLVRWDLEERSECEGEEGRLRAPSVISVSKSSWSDMVAGGELGGNRTIEGVIRDNSRYYVGW